MVQAVSGDSELFWEAHRVSVWLQGALVGLQDELGVSDGFPGCSRLSDDFNGSLRGVSRGFKGFLFWGIWGLKGFQTNLIVCFRDVSRHSRMFFYVFRALRGVPKGFLGFTQASRYASGRFQRRFKGVSEGF